MYNVDTFTLLSSYVKLLVYFLQIIWLTYVFSSLSKFDITAVPFFGVLISKHRDQFSTTGLRKFVHFFALSFSLRFIAQIDCFIPSQLVRVSCLLRLMCCLQPRFLFASDEESMYMLSKQCCSIYCIIFHADINKAFNFIYL